LTNENAALKVKLASREEQLHAMSTQQKKDCAKIVDLETVVRIREGHSVTDYNRIKALQEKNEVLTEKLEKVKKAGKAFKDMSDALNS
jgi:uncharacterized protein (DUF2461 family)